MRAAQVAGPAGSPPRLRHLLLVRGGFPPLQQRALSGALAADLARHTPHNFNERWRRKAGATTFFRQPAFRVQHLGLSVTRPSRRKSAMTDYDG